MKTKAKIVTYVMWSIAAMVLFIAMLCFDHNHSAWVGWFDWAAIVAVASHLIFADELASSIKADYAEELAGLDALLESMPDEEEDDLYQCSRCGDTSYIECDDPSCMIMTCTQPCPDCS